MYHARLIILLATRGLATPEPQAAPVAEPSVEIAPATASRQDAPLYRITTYRAAPGRLLELIEAIKSSMEQRESTGGSRGFLMRHSQGDQWDLMLVKPLGPDVAILIRGPVTSGLALDELVAWREDWWAYGPEVETARARMTEGDYYHVEMFIGLPGKRAELIEQRRMENVYLREIGRQENMIFVRRMGAAWDAMTIGVYRDIKHFAESADIPEDVEERAAAAAGFESASTIGTYLRELIAEHHDTLAVAVR